jgi:hypothetical protein
VDRHVHKARHPVEDARETADGLWTQSRQNHGGQASQVVENGTHMWTIPGQE